LAERAASGHEASRGTALITGGARRIGRALALTAAACGYEVAIHHRASSEDAEALAFEIRAMGRRAEPLIADLIEEAESSALVGRAAAALGPVTLLINNASVFQDDRIETLTRASWDAHMETNLRAPVLLSQAFAAELPQGAEGLIINLLDQRVLKPNPQFFSYGLSRAALWAATRTLAQALAPRIRVNAIGPGPTLASVHQSPEDFAAEARNVILQRRSSPEDIAAAARYLIEARQVTGQMIVVDGGQHLGWRTPDVVSD
jgi:NAD(P)-dependent dehydrogenase (short-subunit alcohol dehydrogenase family)